MGNHGLTLGWNRIGTEWPSYEIGDGLVIVRHKLGIGKGTGLAALTADWNEIGNELAPRRLGLAAALYWLRIDFRLAMDWFGGLAIDLY